MLDRTVEMPVAIAAVLKAGAAYVPLDPAHPPDRLRYIVGDAQVACLITLSWLAEPFDAASVPRVLLDGAVSELDSLETSTPAVAVIPSDVAYVIYTSGSTGRPKGVRGGTPQRRQLSRGHAARAGAGEGGYPARRHHAFVRYCRARDLATTECRRKSRARVQSRRPCGWPPC